MSIQDVKLLSHLSIGSDDITIPIVPGIDVNDSDKSRHKLDYWHGTLNREDW